MGYETHVERGRIFLLSRPSFGHDPHVIYALVASLDASCAFNAGGAMPVSSNSAAIGAGFRARVNRHLHSTDVGAFIAFRYFPVVTQA